VFFKLNKEALSFFN